MTAQFGNQKITEINTGFHHDNLGSNGFLHRNSIDIYGADLTARMVKERSEFTRKEVLKLLEKEHLRRYHDAHAVAIYTFFHRAQNASTEAGMPVL